MADTSYLIFSLESSAYALPVHAVDRVLRAVRLQPLPQAPPLIAGLVNVHGEILPVLDLRRRFELPPKPPEPHHALIRIHTSRRDLLLTCDQAEGLQAFPEADLVDSHKLVEKLDYVSAVIRTDEGMILLCDAEALLAPLEAEQLDEALEATHS